jgi:hypothetical protein
MTISRGENKEKMSKLLINSIKTFFLLSNCDFFHCSNNSFAMLLTKTSTLPEYWSFPLTNRNFVGSEMIYKISGLGLRCLAPLSTIFQCKISKIEMYTSIAKELLLQ